MQLDPGEKSLLAYFATSEQAQAAKENLEAAGFSIIQVDRVSRYGTSYDTEYNKRTSGGADARVLMGADPSNSGMASAGYGLAGGNAFLVTVVTNTELADHAKEILRSEGGNI